MAALGTFLVAVEDQQRLLQEVQAVDPWAIVESQEGRWDDGIAFNTAVDVDPNLVAAVEDLLVQLKFRFEYIGEN